MCTHIMYLITLAWILVCLITPNEAIVGFDCSGVGLNVTTISTIDVEPCNIEKSQQPRLDQKYVQVLQWNKYDMIEVKQCKISVVRSIRSCKSWITKVNDVELDSLARRMNLVKDFFNGKNIGELINDWISSTATRLKDMIDAFFGNNIVPGAQESFIYKITKDECFEAHKNKRVRLSGLNYYFLDNLPNTSLVEERRVDLSGSQSSNDDDDDCEGSLYTDIYGTFPKVYVKAVLTITMNTQMAPALLNDDKITLSGGTYCKFSSGECSDQQFGPSFWESTPTDKDCKDKNAYSVIYKGNAKVSTLDDEELYIVEDSSTTFALMNKGSIDVCGKKIIKTDHPKLYIYVGEEELEFVERENVNDNMFTYINSKFLYVEQNIRKQVQNLHNDYREHHCQLERKILMNQLSIAIINPEEFAYRYMGSPGYKAVPAGEIIYVFKCNEVELEVDPTDKCYEYLPVKIRGVTNSNTPLFITPQKHILVNYSKEIPCNKPLPQTWKIENQWIKFTPDGNKADKPIELKPSNESTWSWETPSNLITSGLFTIKDLSAMIVRMMTPFAEDAHRLNIVNNYNERKEAAENSSAGYVRNLIKSFKNWLPEFLGDYIDSFADWCGDAIDAWIEWRYFIMFLIGGIVVLVVLYYIYRSFRDLTGLLHKKS